MFEHFKMKSDRFVNQLFCYWHIKVEKCPMSNWWWRINQKIRLLIIDNRYRYEWNEKSSKGTFSCKHVEYTWNLSNRLMFPKIVEAINTMSMNSKTESRISWKLIWMVQFVREILGTITCPMSDEFTQIRAIFELKFDIFQHPIFHRSWISIKIVALKLEALI